MIKPRQGILEMANRNAMPQSVTKGAWLRDREAQGQFRFYWRPGKDNLADYWTKHHCGAHHKWMRNVFLTPAKLLEALKASLARSTARFSASKRVC